MTLRPTLFVCAGSAVWLCAAGPGTPIGQKTPADTTHPVAITTDSPAYCETLERTIDAYTHRIPPQTQTLETEGRHLCQTGHVRAGIDRLRRALVTLKHS